jgi:hypothetical protein
VSLSSRTEFRQIRVGLEFSLPPKVKKDTTSCAIRRVVLDVPNGSSTNVARPPSKPNVAPAMLGEPTATG